MGRWTSCDYGCKSGRSFWLQWGVGSRSQQVVPHERPEAGRTGHLRQVHGPRCRWSSGSRAPLDRHSVNPPAVAPCECKSKCPSCFSQGGRRIGGALGVKSLHSSPFVVQGSTKLAALYFFLSVYSGVYCHVPLKVFFQSACATECQTVAIPRGLGFQAGADASV